MAFQIVESDGTKRALTTAEVGEIITALDVPQTADLSAVEDLATAAQSAATAAQSTADSKMSVAQANALYLRTINNMGPDSAGNLQLTVGDIEGALITVEANLTSTSDANALAASQGKSLKDAADALAGTVSGKYVKPVGGIPSTDLTSAVQASLGKADSAIQQSGMAAAMASATLTRAQRLALSGVIESSTSPDPALYIWWTNTTNGNIYSSNGTAWTVI